MTTTACDFDSGPFHEATIAVRSEPTGDLPVVMVTDEGDYWSTYVLMDPRFWLCGRPTYHYDGESTESEIRRCPRVSGDHIEVADA